MGGVSRYAYFNGRLHALFSRMLSEEVFQRMERAGSSEEALYPLSGTPYAGLQTIYSRTGDIKLVEKEIFDRLYLDFSKLAVHAPSEVRPLLDVLTLRYVFNAFKTSLRLWFDQSFRGRSIADFAEYIPRSIPLGRLSADEVINARDRQRVISLLQGTPFKAVVSGLEQLDRTRNLIRCELDLETDYYNRVGKILAGFHGNERSTLAMFFGEEIDEANLGRLLRMDLGKVTPERLFLSGGSRITQPLFMRWCQMTREEREETLVEYFGIPLTVSRRDRENRTARLLQQAAVYFEDRRENLLRKTKTTSLFDAGLTMVYVRRKEAQARRIIRILNECYYGINREGGAL